MTGADVLELLAAAKRDGSEEGTGCSAEESAGAEVREELPALPGTERCGTRPVAVNSTTIDFAISASSVGSETDTNYNGCNELKEHAYSGHCLPCVVGLALSCLYPYIPCTLQRAWLPHKR